MSLTAHMLVHTRCSVVRNPFRSVISPNVGSVFAGLSLLVSEILAFASMDEILDA
jgi:hypothetical protein